MLQTGKNDILSKSKWGAQSVVMGEHGPLAPPDVMALRKSLIHLEFCIHMYGSQGASIWIKFE